MLLPWGTWPLWCKTFLTFPKMPSKNPFCKAMFRAIFFFFLLHFVSFLSQLYHVTKMLTSWLTLGTGLCWNWAQANCCSNCSNRCWRWISNVAPIGTCGPFVDFDSITVPIGTKEETRVYCLTEYNTNCQDIRRTTKPLQKYDAALTKCSVQEVTNELGNNDHLPEPQDIVSHQNSSDLKKMSRLKL